MNLKIAIAASGLIGLATGSVVTYFATKKQIELKYAILLDEEVQEVKNYYRLLRKDDFNVGLAGEVENDEERDAENTDTGGISKEEIKKVQEIINTQGYSTSTGNVPPSAKNVFDDSKNTPPADEEEIFPDRFKQLPDRDPDAPYIIGLDEWVIAGETEAFEREQLTYFEGDDTLLDTEGSIVSDIATVVGIKNLNYFGMGSDSPDIVYIRNEQLGKDFEVMKDEGEYTVKVLGLPSQYPSQDERKIKKMREND